MGSALVAQPFPPRPGPGPGPLPIPIVPQPLPGPVPFQIVPVGPNVGGYCGLHPVSDTSFVAIAPVATMVDPYTVNVSWKGPAGTYAVTTSDGHMNTSISVADQLFFRPGNRPVNRPPSTPTGSIVDEQRLPATQYTYRIKATLPDGRTVCGVTSITTPPPPPPTDLAAAYVNIGRVDLSFRMPPFAHDAVVRRADGAVVANVFQAGRNVAGAGGKVLTGIAVDPGAPQFPYDQAMQYRVAPTSYAFTVEIGWTERPDGTGARRTSSAPVAVSGPPPVVGFADLHSHQVAYFGFGGTPTDYPLGRHFFGKAHGPIDQAMPWCTPQCGPGGIGDLANSVMQKAMLDKPIAVGHLVGGFPQFDGYPRWNSFTGQAYYESALHRANLAGLKLIVVHPVNNEWMCTTLNHTSTAEVVAMVGSLAVAPIYPYAFAVTGALLAKIAFWQGQPPDDDCLDKNSAKNQIDEIWAMQADIDMRVGDGRGNVGPGTGWYRIVRTPQEAREQIAAGKLAVVIGMEIDNPFGCNVTNSSCTADYATQQLKSYYDMGVRHFFPIHFYDNAFGGSANGNFLIANAFKNPMRKRDCSGEGFEYDNHQCNATGLSAVGKVFVRELMRRGMVIDVDHMSSVSFNDAMAIVTPLKYPVVSGHTGFQAIMHGSLNSEGQRTAPQVEAMLNVGGMFAIIPHQGGLDAVDQFPANSFIGRTCGNSSQTLAHVYRFAASAVRGGPVGIGSDLDGFAGWPSPRFGPDACSGGKAPGYDANTSFGRLSYPFQILASGVNVSSTSLDPGPDIDGAGRPHPTMDGVGHSQLGEKVFDYNVDGFAHIGLLPDMIADMEAQGLPPAELDPFFRSAEGYIRLWERATYIAGHS